VACQHGLGAGDAGLEAGDVPGDEAHEVGRAAGVDAGCVCTRWSRVGAKGFHAAGKCQAMTSQLPIAIPRRELADYCRRNHIVRLALFGSVLREDFGSASDVDVLVEFEEHHAPGLLGLSAMQRELSELLGRRVDLNTKGFLSPYFAAEVLREAQEQYVAA